MRPQEIRSLIISALGLAVIAGCSGVAAAQEAGGATVPAAALDKLRQTIQEQERRLSEAERELAKRQELFEAQNHILARQSEKIEGLSQQVDALSMRWANEYGTFTVWGKDGYLDAVFRESNSDSRTTLAQTAPRAPTPLPPEEIPPTAPEAQPPGDTSQEARPESERAVEELLVESGAVLLPRGTLQIEPSLEYSHVSTSRVAISGFTIFEAIVIGLIRVDEIERDTLTAALNVRYGLLDRFQIEARVPYIYRSDSEILGIGTNQQSELNINGYDVGDIEIAGSYQVLSQNGYIPGTILRLRGRFPTGQSAFDIDTMIVDVAGTQQQRLSEAPTGSGFYAVAPGATFIWRVDPVAFFAGGSYTVNLERDQGNFGTIDPGDTIEYFAGMNIGLSDRTSFNVSFVDQITSKTVVDGVDQAGTDTNDARLSVGASISLTPTVSLLASAAAGLTEESPDFTFLVSVPVTLSLF